MRPTQRGLATRIAVWRLAEYLKEGLVPVLLFTLLACLSLRDVIARTGIVGFGWDWGLPILSEQYRLQLSTFLYAWVSKQGAGVPNIFPIDAFFWIIMSILSPLGGEAASKSLLVGLMVLSASSMYCLCRVLGVQRGVALLPAVFYMFSPVVFSRIIAGHLQFLFGYSLLPLFVASVLRFVDSKTSRTRNAVVAGLLFTLVSQSHLFAVLGIVILLTMILTDWCMARRPFIHAVFLLAVIGIVFVFLNMSWLISFIASPVAVSNWYVASRGPSFSPVAYVRSASAHLTESFRILATSRGLETEVVFPQLDSPTPLWTFASFLVPFWAFSTLLFRLRNRRYLAFVVLALLGVSLTSGTSTIVGATLFRALANVPMVMAAFKNPMRFGPLVALSYGVLLGFAGQHVYTLWRRLMGSDVAAAHLDPRTFHLKKGAVALILFTSILLPIGVYPWAFFTGDLTRLTPYHPPDQPYNLLVTPVDNEYRRTLAWLEDNRGDFRVAYLPSPFMGYPPSYWKDGKRKLFHISTGYLPNPDVMDKMNEPLARAIGLILHRPETNSLSLERLLAIGSVKYVIFTDYQKFMYYDQGHNYDALRKSLHRASGLNVVAVNDQTSIMEYRGHLPRLYAVPVSSTPHLATETHDSSTGLVFGNPISLVPLAETGHLDGNPALFFASQQKNEVLRKIVVESSHSLRQTTDSFIFHDQGVSDLSLQLIEPLRYRYGVSSYDQTFTFSVKAEGTYAFFAKPQPTKDISALRLDIKPLLSTQLIPPNLADPFGQLLFSAHTWRYFGNATLHPGQYSISMVKGDQAVPKLSDEMEEIIVVPLHVLQETTHQVVTLLGDPNKRIAYLFTGSETTNAQSLSAKASSNNESSFYAPRGEGYILRARLAPNVQRRNTYLLQERTDWGHEMADGKWQISEVRDLKAGDTGRRTASERVRTLGTVERKEVVDGRLVLPVSFERDGGVDEYVLLKRSFPGGVDLEEFPQFRLRFKVDNPDVQVLDATFGIDYTGDGEVDGNIHASATLLAGTGEMEVDLNLLEAAKERFANAYYQKRREFKLVKLFLLPHKRSGLDASKEKKGMYRFTLDDLQIYNDRSITMLPGSQLDLRRAVVLATDGADVRSQLDGGHLALMVPDRNKSYRVVEKLAVVLKDGKRLTGIVEQKDQRGIRLSHVNELAGRAVEVNLSAVAYSFNVLQEESGGETLLSTRNVGLSIPVEGKHKWKYPFLTFEYKIKGPEGLSVEAWLRVRNTRGAIQKLFAGRPSVIDPQRFATAKETYDLDRGIRLFEFSLDQAFPEAYTTQGGGKGRFVVLKDGQPIDTTWQSWQTGTEQVEIGASGPRSVSLAVPLGDHPLRHNYVVRYLSPDWRSESPTEKGTIRMNIDLKDVIENEGAELISLDLLPIGAPGAGPTAAGQGGPFTFWLWNVELAERRPYPVKDLRDVEVDLRGLFDRPLVEIDGRPIIFAPPEGQTNLLDGEGYWLEPLKVDLAEGLHNLRILPHPTFKVDLVEVANKALDKLPVNRQQPVRVEFQKTNPTRYVIDVDTGKPFWLVFNENFHEGWKGYIRTGARYNDQKEPWSALRSWWKDRGKRVELKDHFVVNGYANGWYVDIKDVPGSGFRVPGKDHNGMQEAKRFQIILEYQPQRLFEVGLLISGLTLLGCISFLGYDFGKRSWSRAKSEAPARPLEDP